MPRIVYITTLPVTAAFLLRGQLRAVQDAGFDVHVICSPGPLIQQIEEREGVTVHPLPMPREVDPRGDAVALVRLVRLLRKLRPTIVNASTPKAGLLGMLAARIARVPVRIYLLRGLRLETTTGNLRRVLGTSERLAARCAHQVVSVSHSLHHEFAGTFAPADRCRVLGEGSSNGVSAERFARSTENLQGAADLRASLRLSDAFTVGFAGRMVEDKGVLYVLDAFARLREQIPAQLLMIGDDLAGDHLDAAVRARIEADPHIHVLPKSHELGPFYALIDVLAFPSLREGFPNVPLEAAMAGRPVVGFDSTGVRDAVLHGVTGTLVPQRDPVALADALLDYAREPGLVESHGDAAHRRAVRDFRPEDVWARWIDLYRELMAARRVG